MKKVIFLKTCKHKIAIYDFPTDRINSRKRLKKDYKDRVLQNNDGYNQLLKKR